MKRKTSTSSRTVKRPRSGFEKKAGGKKPEIRARLFTDDTPASTVKGLGFKNAEIAKRTVEITSQPGVRYKQYLTIKTMYERAKHHPHQSPGMCAAMKIFKKWLDENDHTSRKQYKHEWEHRRSLAESPANAHARNKFATDKEFKLAAREDMKNGKQKLKSMIQQFLDNSKSVRVAFPITEFVALFGGPALHGYGSHLCNDKPMCECGFTKMHVIEADGEYMLPKKLSKVVKKYTLQLFSKEEEVVVTSLEKRELKNSSILSFFKKKSK